MKRLNLNFSNYSEPTLETLAFSIVAAVKASAAYFPLPLPELTAAETAADDFSEALAKAKSGDRLLIADKNDKRLVLEQALAALGLYVMGKAMGNITVLIASGFPISKEREPSPPMGDPLIKSLGDGQASGEVVAKVGRVQSARMYDYQYTLDPLTAANQWTGQTTTLTNLTFKNLETGKKYWFRVVAMGLNGQVTYSDPVALLVR